MRIVFITQEVDRDGDILGFVHRWLEVLADHDAVDRVDVICLREGEHDLPSNVTVTCVDPSGRASRVAKFVRMQRRLATLAVTGDVDVVFAHMCEIYVTLSFPYTLFGDTTMAYWKTHGGLSRHIEFAHDRADVLFTASAESFDLDSEKKTPVGHGIDTTHFSPSGARPPADDRDHVLSIGRIAESKNHDLLVDAVGLLVREHGRETVQLDIVGGPRTPAEQDHFERLQARVDRRGLGDHVVFHGSVAHPEVPPLYRQADVTVNASETGSLDKVVLEAMATGTPVVTTNRAFAPLFDGLDQELLVDDLAPEPIAERIDALLGSDTAELGRRLRSEVVENHSVTALMDDIVAHLRRLRGTATATPA